MREDVLQSLPPDVADWSVADVCFYIKSHGYPGESKLFEDQVCHKNDFQISCIWFFVPVSPLPESIS